MTELTFKITKDISTIRKYLTDIEKFVSVHPLIYKMIDLGANNYKVFEKIKMGILFYHFTYRATITNDNHSVKMNASVMGLTQLTMHFNFQREGDMTIIKEQLTVQSVLPIKKFMVRLIGRQHQAMFKKIDNLEND